MAAFHSLARSDLLGLCGSFSNVRRLRQGNVYCTRRWMLHNYAVIIWIHVWCRLPKKAAVTAPKYSRDGVPFLHEKALKKHILTSPKRALQKDTRRRFAAYFAFLRAFCRSANS